MPTSVITPSKPKVSKKKKETTLKKAPGAPKRFRSSFILFFVHVQENIAKNLPKGQIPSAPAVSKRASQMWKALSAEERQFWDAKAEKEKERYIREKEVYKGPWQVPNLRAKRDPTAPKRNPSAFLLYSIKNRKLLRKKHPELKNTEISRMLGSGWHDMSENDKKPFIEQEAAERVVYMQRVAEWKVEQKKKKELLEKQKEAMFNEMPTPVTPTADKSNSPKLKEKNFGDKSDVNMRLQFSEKKKAKGKKSASNRATSTCKTVIKKEEEGIGEISPLPLGSTQMLGDSNPSPQSYYPPTESVLRDFNANEGNEVRANLDVNFVEDSSSSQGNASLHDEGDRSGNYWNVASQPSYPVAARDTNAMLDVNFVEESSSSQGDASSQDGTDAGGKPWNREDIIHPHYPKLHSGLNESLLSPIPLSPHPPHRRVALQSQHSYFDMRNESEERKFGAASFRNVDQNNVNTSFQGHVPSTIFRDDTNPHTTNVGNITPSAGNGEKIMLEPSFHLSFDDFMNEEPEYLRDIDIDLADNNSFEPLPFDTEGAFDEFDL